MKKRMMAPVVCLLLGMAPALGQEAGQGKDSSGSTGTGGIDTDVRTPRDYGGTGSAAAGRGSARSNDDGASTPRAPSASSARGDSEAPLSNPSDDAGQSHDVNNTVDGRPGP